MELCYYSIRIGGFIVCSVTKPAQSVVIAWLVNDAVTFTDTAALLVVQSVDTAGD